MKMFSCATVDHGQTGKRISSTDADTTEKIQGQGNKQTKAGMTVLSWHFYIPRYLVEQIAHDPLWSKLMCVYIVALNANPVRKQLVRAYVSHSHDCLYGVERRT